MPPMLKQLDNFLAMDYILLMSWIKVGIMHKIHGHGIEENHQTKVPIIYFFNGRFP